MTDRESSRIAAKATRALSQADTAHGANAQDLLGQLQHADISTTQALLLRGDLEPRRDELVRCVLAVEARLAEAPGAGDVARLAA